MIPDERPSPSYGRGRAVPLGFAVILILAATLRFTGLAWGLRHAPESDERLFVASVVEMIRHGDMDQRFYEYPGLFFHVLRLPLLLLTEDARLSNRAYLVARAVVASFGILSVLLTFELGRRLVSARAALVAALFLAVSPVEVMAAHMVRPDVALEAFALLFLLVLYSKVGGHLRDALAGVALGAAVAVKPTGVFLFPSLALDRLLRPGPRVLGLMVACACAAAVFLLATPYLLVQPAEFERGFSLQWAYHYSPLAREPGTSVGFYLGTLAESLGFVGCALVVVGLWQARSRFRVWALLVLFPVCLFGALATASAHWTRLVVPSLGAVSVIAALGFESAVARWPRTAWAITLAGSLVPLASSLAYLQEVTRPGTRDRAVDWIEAHLPVGSTVLTGDGSLGLDPSRFQVFHAHGVAVSDALFARDADVVVWKEGVPILPGLAPAITLTSPAKAVGRSLSVYTLPEAVRPRSLPLQGPMLDASSARSDLPALVDGRLDTYWRADSVGTDPEWIEIDLGRPVRLCRIDLLLGERVAHAGRHLAVWVAEAGGPWRRVPAAVYRPVNADDASSDDGPAQVLVMEPTLVRRFRVSALATTHHRWSFAELHVYEAPGAP